MNEYGDVEIDTRTDIYVPRCECIVFVLHCTYNFTWYTGFVGVLSLLCEVDLLKEVYFRFTRE